MLVAIGRRGILDGVAGRRMRELRPDWDFEEAVGAAWPGLLARADVAVPVTAVIDDDVLDGSSVSFVQQFGAGYDAIDLSACRRRGIPVANIPSTRTPNAVSVAELAVAMTLDLLRRVDGWRAAARGEQAPSPTRTVAGRTVLIVGLGGIGTEVAARLRAFDVRLAGVRAHPEHGGPDGVEEVGGPDDLDELLGRADAVICCAPASGDAAMFDAGRFAAMRPGAVLVNVARGALVDEAALLAALSQGSLAGAGLDVFAEEPPDPTGPLVTHPRVIATPHIAGATVENLLGAAEAVVDNITRVAAGEQPAYRVD